MPESPSREDKVYADPRAAVEKFAFDANVASVFDDMIRRSVPGYTMTLSLLGIIAQRYAQPSTRVYDLGCSLGAGMLAMGDELTTSRLTFVGVDSSPAMLERCRVNLARLEKRYPVELRQEDILDTPIRDASVVVLNFTLQFIPQERRIELLDRIRAGMAPGGILVLSEKIRFEDERIQEDLATLHHDFKRANGYSDLEISQKRTALENVLIPETLSEHSRRLREAGFARSEVWLQCFNFASLLAFN